MLVGCVRDQVDAIVRGFKSLISDTWLDFSANELEAMLCGNQTITVQSLKSHTKVVGFAGNSHTVDWFWSILESFSQVYNTALNLWLNYSIGRACQSPAVCNWNKGHSLVAGALLNS